MQDAPAPEVPRVLRVLSRVALVAGILLTLVGAFRIGVTWDEPLHVQRFNNYSHTGWYLGDGQLVGDQPGPAMKQQYVYGPATMLILNGLGAVTGVEHLGTASTTSSAYTVRHVGIALISFLGLLAVIGTGRLLFRRWDWAIVSGSVLAVLPMWTGHSMFNLKDVPVATGYSLVTLGLSLLARRSFSAPTMVRAAGPLAIGGGTFLAVGTRPGIWVTLFASVFAYAFCVLVRTRRSGWRSEIWRVRDLALGAVTAGIALYLVYPRVFGSPLDILIGAPTESVSFLSSPAPWYFIPVRVLLQVPGIMLGFLIVGIVAGMRHVITSRPWFGSSQTRLTLIFVQLLTIPVLAMIHGATLYSDLRQVLFAAPASALLMTYGMFRLASSAARMKDKNARPLASAVTCAALIVPLIDQAMLFPYDYAYYNELAAAGRVPGNGDYYRASGREIVPYLPASGRIVCSPEGDEQGARRQAHVDGWVDCRDPSSSPIAAFLDKRNTSYPPLDSDEFWAVTFDSRGHVFKNCTLIHLVHRRTLFRNPPLVALARCRRPYPVLTSKPVEIRARDNNGYTFLDLGWHSPLVDAIENGILSNGRTASLRFRLDSQFEKHAIVLELDVRADMPVLASYGGAVVASRMRQEGSKVEIFIPQELIDQGIDSAQTLELHSENGGDLDIRLISIRARLSPARGRTPTPGRAGNRP